MNTLQRILTHFKTKWKEVKKRDDEKEELAMKLEGLSVLRLNQVKIWKDKESNNYDWKNMILEYGL